MTNYKFASARGLTVCTELRHVLSLDPRFISTLHVHTSPGSVKLLVFPHRSLNVFKPTAQQIPMATYPVEPMYDAYGKPLGPSEYLHAGYPMVPQYPGMPPQYPVMQPGPYPPQSMDPAYSQGKISITFSGEG